MDSAPDSQSTVHVRLLGQLRDRLIGAHALTDDVQRAMSSGDVDSIENATGRLETLVQEFKLLQEEFHRLPIDEKSIDPQVAEAKSQLEQTAVGLMRSTAIGSGVLERLITMSRGLVDAVNLAQGEAYLPTGQTQAARFAGMRLKETV